MISLGTYGDQTIYLIVPRIIIFTYVKIVKIKHLEYNIIALIQFTSLMFVHM